MMTLDAMKKHFSKVENINLKEIEVNLGAQEKPTVLYEGKPLENYDCVYAKGSFRYAPILRSLTEALYSKVYMPITPESFIIGHDKILTHLNFQQRNIPMPTTYLATSAKAAKKTLTEVNYPIVLKFPHGTQGIGVMFAESFGSAASMLDALIALKQPFLIQEYIDTDGMDIRAFVVGNKVVASMKRKSMRGEIRSNVHAGGKGEPYSLDTHSRRVAIDAAKAVGAEICAIDMLEGPKGPLVIEANLSPGLQGITEATEVDVADKIAKHLYHSASKHKEEGSSKTTKRMFKELDIADSSTAQHIITHLNFRADRILLPKIVTDMTGFTESDEFVVRIEKSKVLIEKM